MSKEKDVIKALVKLAMCPGNHSECTYTAMCSHACHGEACAKKLRDEYGSIFNDVFSTIFTDVVDQPESTEQLAQKVTRIMHDIGFPAHVKGYAYLRTAIIKAVEEPCIIEAITKELYPTIAYEFHTTPSRVERAIRHSIEIAWNRGDVDVLQKYFGYTVDINKGKPTNSEFIALIADKLRLDM